MDWIQLPVGKEHESIPLNKPILCKYKGHKAYVVLEFTQDDEYGICANLFEEYLYPREFDKYCIIK